LTHISALAAVLTISLTVTESAQAQDVWVQRDTVNGPPKTAACAFAMGGLGYVGSGFDHTDYKRSFYRYQPWNDDWDKVASLGNDEGLGLNRNGAVAFAIGTLGFVTTGSGDDPYFKDLWMYHPGNDVWTQKADFAGTGRRSAVAFSAAGKGYVGTGQDINGYTNDFWQYDYTGNSWTPVATFPGAPRRLAVGFTIGGKGYVGTGDDGTFAKDFYEYDPATNVWTQKADFGGTARYGATGFGNYTAGFIGTGYDNTLNYTNDFWEYHYHSDTWEQRAPFPGSARSNAVGFAIGGSGYIGTGYDGQPREDFYEYTPILSTEEINARIQQLEVYPNPAVDAITVSFDGEISASTLAVEVYALDGKNVTDRVSVLSSATSFDRTSVRLNVSQLNTGNYLLKGIGDYGQIVGSATLIKVQ
jgi:N-acetylneuraminic acid mutarotase